MTLIHAQAYSLAKSDASIGSTEMSQECGRVLSEMVSERVHMLGTVALPDVVLLSPSEPMFLSTYRT